MNKNGAKLTQFRQFIAQITYKRLDTSGSEKIKCVQKPKTR